jgi:hypothetical protein
VEVEAVRKKLLRALFGHLLFDDRKGTPIEGLPPPPPWWSRVWWGDEDFPMWWNWSISVVRRFWYLGRKASCICEGCDHVVPSWWSSGMCVCCTNDDCCHEEEDSAA